MVIEGGSAEVETLLQKVQMDKIADIMTTASIRPSWLDEEFYASLAQAIVWSVKGDWAYSLDGLQGWEHADSDTEDSETG